MWDISHHFVIILFSATNLFYNFINTNNFNIFPLIGHYLLGKNLIYLLQKYSAIYTALLIILYLNSNHCSVLLYISTSALICIKLVKLFFSFTNCLQFQNILNEQVNPKIKLNSNLDIDEAVNNLTTLIQLAAWVATIPEKTYNSYSNSHLVFDKICSLI